LQKIEDICRQYGFDQPITTAYCQPARTANRYFRHFVIIDFIAVYCYLLCIFFGSISMLSLPLADNETIRHGKDSGQETGQPDLSADTAASATVGFPG
jgi:hypothetical protein